MAYKTYWFLEILSYCAVDAFAIISGYVATDKPRKFSKLAEMWFQVIFYSFGITLALTIIGINESFGIKEIIKCLMPVMFGKFWYFTAFFGLFFAIPLLNKYLFSIDLKTARKVLIILFVMFSVMSIFMDPFKTEGGYSMIWLIVLYCIGVLAKRTDLLVSMKSIYLIIAWALCIIITWVVFIFVGKDLLINYISPTILLSGLIMVVLFSRINLRGGIVSKLSPLAFGIYLFQLNQVIWNEVICNAFSFVAKMPVLLGVVYVFGFALVIFVSGMLVEFVRKTVFKWLREDKLCEKIVDMISRILNAIVVKIN